MRRTARPWLIAITVEGLNLGRFLRRVGEEKIVLNKLRRQSSKRITALVCENTLPQVQKIALDGGWTLHIGERKGAGHAAEWLLKRWLFVGMGMIAGASLFLCSQVMWQVEIVDAGTYQADISAALQDLGIKAPMLRSQVNIDLVRQELEWRYPRIAWMECGWRGTTLVVRPVEGVLPNKETSTGEVCDIVAGRDAIVHRIATKSGTPVVKIGDFVHQGDVLIKGEERTHDGNVKPVSADGSVIGRAWIGASVMMSVAEQHTEYTGQEQIAWTVRTPWFDLWRMEECPYVTYDIAVSEQWIGGMFFPVKMYSERRLEVEVKSQRRGEAEISAEAEQAAMGKLQEKLTAEESLIDIWGNCSMIDDEKVHAQAIGEVLVEIGVQRVSTGMAAPVEDDSE